MGTTETPKTEAERLQIIIDSLGLNAHSFSQELELKSSGTIYHILNGINGISYGMKMKILKKFPKLNIDFIDTGLGNVFKEKQETNKNDLSFSELFEMPNQLQRIENKLDTLLKLMQEKNN